MINCWKYLQVFCLKMECHNLHIRKFFKITKIDEGHILCGNNLSDEISIAFCRMNFVETNFRSFTAYQISDM